MKVHGLVILDKIFLKIALRKPIFWTSDILILPIGTILTILLEGHPIIIPIKLYKIGPSSLGG